MRQAIPMRLIFSLLFFVYAIPAVAESVYVFNGSPGMGSGAHSLSDAQVKQHASAVAKPAIPPGIRQLVERLANAWARHDMDEVMAQFHPRYGSNTAKNLTDLQVFLSTQVAPATNRYEWQIGEIREEGNIAYVQVVIHTDLGDVPITSRFINEGERWYILGNQPQ